MVKVTNGIETFTIPEGAVKVYGNMGFKPIGGKHVSKPKNETKSNTDEAGEDGFKDLLSKPISQWNQDEVKEFAAAKGYDVSGAKSLKQAKAIIKEALDFEEQTLAEA